MSQKSIKALAGRRGALGSNGFFGLGALGFLTVGGRGIMGAGDDSDDDEDYQKFGKSLDRVPLGCSVLRTYVIVETFFWHCARVNTCKSFL